MFSDVNNFLNFSSQANILHGLVGIAEKKADSSFLLHHFVSLLLRESTNSLCLLSFSQTFNHFNIVGNKIGSNLTAAVKQEKLMFIDGLRSLSSAMQPGISQCQGDTKSFLDRSGRLDIQAILEFIIDHLDSLKTKSGKVPDLIIDSVSLLIDLGSSAKDIIFLVQYVRSYCSDCHGNVVVLGVNSDHGEEDEELNSLWNYIQHCSWLILTVSGLDTGYSKEVHGQITARWNDTASTKKKEEKKTQYKLTDKTCILFASGLSSAVL